MIVGLALLAASVAAAQPLEIALVRHAPSVNGRVEGSLHLLLPENVALSGSAALTGDLLVPGTPAVRLNGRPAYGGTLDGSGASAPNNYQVTLGGNAALRHVVRRSDPLPLPVVAAPPLPAGTRTVVLETAGQSAGGFSTLRNLTVAGVAGLVTVPAGNYGEFTAIGGGAGFVLGAAGATQPARYGFQRLTLADQARLQVVGPVIVTVASGVAASGTMGAAARPEWLALQIAAGGLTLQGGSSCHGSVAAPAGTVAINGNSVLAGALACDRLSLGGASMLRLVSIAPPPPPNQLPTVRLTAPAEGATFPAPVTFMLQAAATDPDGTIARVEFFQGAVRLGVDETSPYELTVSGLAAGTHTFFARVFDNLEGAADSPPLTVHVTSPNRPPVVELTSPAEGAVFAAPAAIALAATASDPDGTVARVEFFQSGTKLGESTTAPFAFVWTNVPPGAYSLSARAFDHAGASATSAARTVTVQAVLPYFADFEAAEGFAPGPLAGQHGWTATGSVAIVDTAAASGSRAVVLEAGSPPTQLAQAFPPGVGAGVVFVDLFVRPVAGAAPEQAILLFDAAAQVAFVRMGTQGEWYVLAGDGTGGGGWRATGHRLALLGDGQAAAWLRLTLREDFAAKKWDLYVDGRLIAADLGFRDGTLTHYTQFALAGHSGAAVMFDDFFAGYDNPLFVDADRDGLDDAWELRNGLDPTRNDRGLDLDGDGLSNLREYLLGTRANSADSDGDGLNDAAELTYGTDPSVADLAGLPARIAGLRLHLRADAGVATDAGGGVQTWHDQSGRAAHATQAAADERPQLIATAANGRPAVRFDGANDWLALPNLMAGATAGQVFAILRAAAFPSDQARAAWNFGGGNGTEYPGGTELWDDFGAPSQLRLGPPIRDLTSFHLYDVSSRPAEWLARLNDAGQLRSAASAVVFRSDPTLGRMARYFGRYHFAGEIAEIIVYDRVLPAADRLAILAYLNAKYALRLPAADLLARAPGGDPDGDGVSNRLELEVHGTDPFNADTDGDGLPDGWEIARGTQPLVADAQADPDGDGLSNHVELVLGSAPLGPAARDTTGALRLLLFRPDR